MNVKPKNERKKVMETNVTKVVVKNLKASDNVENSVQVECESVTNFDEMTVDEILSSGGVRKYVFFLKNCMDKIESLKKALLNKDANVCVYTAQVSEIADGKTSVSVVDDGKVTATYTALTYVIPCKAGFEPSETDIKNALETLKAQVARRVASGTYELE